MKKVMIVNATDCPRRTLDSSNLHRFFTGNGYEVVTDQAEADDILLVTCAAWDLPEDQSVQALEELKTHGKNLVLLGCLSVINAALANQHFQGTAIPPKDLHRINDLYPHEIPFEYFDGGNDSSDYVKSDILASPNGSRPRLRSAIRNVQKLWSNLLHLGPTATGHVVANHLFKRPEYSLKISEGCVGTCTYCGIRKAIGRIQSRPLEVCLQDLRHALVTHRYRSVAIVADDTGAYGVDSDESFVELLDEITTLDEFFVLNLGGLNPRWLGKYFHDIKRVLNRKRVVSLVVPIQSGSQRIVDLMNRKYDIQVVKELLTELKTEHPYLHLNTHIIAGFPTESDDDAIAGVSFLRDVPIDSGRVMMFCPRPNTAGATMEGQLTPEEKHQRMIQYHELLVQNRFEADFKGGTYYAIDFLR